MLTKALIINAVILFAVLEADLGSRRKVSTIRILRPLLTAGAIVPMFIQAVATHGTGLALEIGGSAAGILLGFIASRLMTVRLDRETDRAVTRAGLPYATLWILVVGARSLFSIGSTHWFDHALGVWMTSHQVSAAAITDTLIFMAIAMTTTRTVALAARTHEIVRRTPRLVADAA